MEFGANKKVKEPFRKDWTEAVRAEADKFNFSWGYWEFCSNFGIYDRESGTWSQELNALIPDSVNS